MEMRDSWDVYFMKVAEIVSTRATCNRKHCGAVITKNNRIIATGYNGSDSGEPHCDEVGHFMVNNHCARSLHAETNALKMAKENNADLSKCKIYINTFPCWNCFGQIVESGIKEIFYKDEYKINQFILDSAELFDVKITKVEYERI